MINPTLAISAQPVMLKVKHCNLLNFSIVLALEEEPQVCQVCEAVLLVGVALEDLVEALVKVVKVELVCWAV